MQLTIAVISDLHCHHSSTVAADSLLITDGARRPNAQHPVSAFRDLVEMHEIHADVVLMPGDLANRADPQGMNSGWEYVQEIAKSLQAGLLAPTLGNHDVVSRVPSDDPFRLVKGLYPEFPGLGPDCAGQFWAKGYCIIERENVRVLLINSAACHNNAESAKRGLITPQQLADLESYLNAASSRPFQIAVCHHHPILHENIGLGTSDVMENGSQLIELLSKYRFDLLVHGHKHHPRLSYSHGCRPLPVLAAGSFAAGMKNGLATRTRNVFHVVNLSRQRIDTPSCGVIKTWQFQLSKGWTPATHSAADFPHLTGFGCYIPPETLAEAVFTRLQSSKQKLIKWEQLLHDMPDLRFIPPAVFEAVAKHAEKKGITFTPPAPDVPTYIGVAT